MALKFSNISRSVDKLREIFQHPELISDLAVSLIIPPVDADSSNDEFLNLGDDPTSVSVGSDSVYAISLDDGEALDLLWDRKEGNVAFSRRLLFHLYPEGIDGLNLFTEWKSLQSSNLLSRNDSDQDDDLDNDDENVSKDDFNDPLNRDRLDSATMVVLLVNGGHETALNIRGWILEKLVYDQLSRSQLYPILERELCILRWLLHIHPKSPALWIYRRKILRRWIPKPSSVIVHRELDLIKTQALSKSHNYYAWSHWQWIMNPDGWNALELSTSETVRTNLLQYSKHSSSCTSFRVLQAERLGITEEEMIVFLEDMIGRTPLHFAPFHHILKHLEHLIIIAEKPNRISTPNMEKDSNHLQILFNRFMELSNRAVSLYPEAESCCLFRTLLMDLWTQVNPQSDSSLRPISTG